MLVNKEFKQGVLPRILKNIYFKKVKVENLLYNIKPILYLCFTIAYLPFLLIWLFSLKKQFTNTILGIEGYQRRKF